MTRTRLLAYGVLFSVSAFTAAWLAVTHPDNGSVVSRFEREGRGELELHSAEYHLDQVYMSMEGPRGNQPRIKVSLDATADETVWLTGLETSLVDAATNMPISNEFFCHSNLTLNPDTTSPEQHNRSFKRRTHVDWRFFTLVPGRMEMQLPEGFGMPLKNATLLDYYTMSLNQNAGVPDRTIRMRTRLCYQRDTAPAGKIRPLFRRALYVYQQHTPKSEESPVFCDGGSQWRDESAYESDIHRRNALLSTHDPLATHEGERCAEISTIDKIGRTPSRFSRVFDSHPGATCCVVNASQDGVVPQFGNENTVHWLVPPGRHQYRTEVTEQMQLPFNTKAHYVTGHLHPFGTSLKLVDLESGETVVEITAQSFEDKLGVETVSEMKSSDGVPIYQGRRYELIAQYDNTLDQPVDAMGILYVYALDEAPCGAPDSDDIASR